MFEAAIAWGYPTLAAWLSETDYNKAIVLSHNLEKRTRDNYEYEKQKENAKRDKKGEAKQRGHPVWQHREALLRERLAAVSKPEEQ